VQGFLARQVSGTGLAAVNPAYDAGAALTPSHDPRRRYPYPDDFLPPREGLEN